ncbi:MAG: nucleotidyltransferase domain-containing protein [Candidatus Helarchaeota archaeon]
MDKETKQKINYILNDIRKRKFFSKIEFIILYGSRLGEYHLPNSDIDLCIYIDGNAKELAKIRLDLLKSYNNNLDIQIFQLLPIYVQIEILKGKVIYVKNEKKLYDIAYNTIEEFEDFYPFYLDYINR